jgi:hypothetical protein
MNLHINAMAAVLGVVMLGLVSMPAGAVTDEQKEALRTDCRSDFIAHCKGVSPGGMEAFECLAKNVDSLSMACQGAVKAVDPKAE